MQPQHTTPQTINQENDMTKAKVAKKAPETDENKDVAPETNSDVGGNSGKIEGLKGTPIPSPELEPTPVSENLSLEDQIEAWREQANDVIKVLEKNKEGNFQVDNARENLWRKIATKLNQLTIEWSEKNKTEGYTIIVERRGMNASGMLTIKAASSSEGYSCISDIDAAVANYCKNDEDSLVEVTSSLSTNTKTARILASTVAGFGLQTHDIYPEYKPKKELLPLDKLPRHNVNQGNQVEGPRMTLNK